jgi:hypothetical protein
MAENNNSKAFTHTAYGFRRQGRKFGVWKEIGDARAELPDGTPVVDVKNATIRVFLDRLTLGFAGGVLLVPIGMQPPLPPPAPRRPGQVDEEDDEQLDS